jgi:hypothetical protein
MRQAQHPAPDAFGPLSRSHAVERSDRPKDLNASRAREPVPEFVVGNGPPRFIEPPQLKRDGTAHQNPWKRGHGAFQEVARKVCGRSGIALRAHEGRRRRSSRGLHADRDAAAPQAGKHALQIPGIKGVVLVEHHDPVPGSLPQTAVPVSDGTQCRAVGQVFDRELAETLHHSAGLGSAAVIANNHFKRNPCSLRRNTGQRFMEKLRPVEGRDCDRDERCKMAPLGSEVRPRSDTIIRVLCLRGEMEVEIGQTHVFLTSAVRRRFPLKDTQIFPKSKRTRPPPNPATGGSILPANRPAI